MKPLTICGSLRTLSTKGEGRSYYLVRRGGNWTKALLRDEVLS